MDQDMRFFKGKCGIFSLEQTSKDTLEQMRGCLMAVKIELARTTKPASDLAEQTGSWSHMAFTHPLLHTDSFMARLLLGKLA